MKSIQYLIRIAAIAMPSILMMSGCSEPTPGEKDAAPLVEKNVSARGGLDAWRAIDSMTMSGQMDAGKLRSSQAIKAMLDSPVRRSKQAGAVAKNQPETGNQEDKVVQLPFVKEQARPRKQRIELTFQGQNAIQVYDGEQGWKLRPFLGRHEVENYTPDELKLASNEQELDGILIDHKRKGNRVEAEGTEQVEGRDAYKLKVTLSNGEVRHVWLDKETYLEVKIDGTRKMDGKPRPMTTYLRDYKKVDGLQIPHLLETRVDGVVGSERIIVEKVALNSPIADERFQKPQ